LTLVTLGVRDGVGVVTGGAVSIDGVTTGAARQLRYIEGTGILVTHSASHFAGSLALVASGEAITVETEITTGQAGDRVSDLWLLQSGAVAATTSAIGLAGATVVAGGDLTILQAGSTAGDGIAIVGSSLTAAGDLAVVQTGRIGATQGGIRLSSSAVSAKPVALAVGASAELSLRTNSNSLVLEGDGDKRLRGGKLELELVGGAVQSQVAGGGAVPKQGYGLDLDGMELWLSGDAGASLAEFNLGGGSLTVMSDQSYLTAPLTIGAETTLANLGFGASIAGEAGQRSLGGLTLRASRDSALNGMGFLYGGLLTLDGVSASGAGSLTAIAARAILVKGESQFRGPLSLISTGGDVAEFNLSSADIPQKITGGILIPAGITVGGDGEDRHDLRLIQQGKVRGYGLYLGGVITVSGSLVLRQEGQVTRDGILLGGTLTAGGAVTVIQAGSAAEDAGSVGIRAQWATVTAPGKLEFRQEGVVVNGDGLVIQSSTLSAGADLELAQMGTVTGVGIRLYRFGYGSTQGLSLAAGSERNWLSLRTQNRTLLLDGVDRISLERGRILLDIGTGTVQSQAAVSAVGASPDLSLTATGLELYYRGASTGHGVALHLGNGKFFRLVDKLGDYRLDPQDSELGLAALLPDGITLNSANPSPLGLAVRVAGVLTLDGAHSTRAEELRFLASEIRITGAPSGFAGGLTLDSSGTIDLGANLTFGAAGLSLKTDNKDLILKADCVLAGGAVRLDLGTGVYDNGAAGYFLATSEQNLSFKAGSIANHSALVIFKLGRGQIFATGVVRVASLPTGPAAAVFVSDYPDYLTDGRDAVRSQYYFTSLVGTDLAAAKQAKGNTGTALWLPLAALTASRLGRQITSYETPGSGGLSRDRGSIGWSDGELQTSVDITLANGRGVHFYGVATTDSFSATPEAVPSWLATASELVFDGRNQFDQGLRLVTSGAIRQSRDSALWVSGGELSLIAGGAITLDQSGNRLTSLGLIAAGEAVTIVSQGSLHLRGSFTVGGGGLSLTTAPGSDLILDGDLVSEGGGVTLNLGGTYSPKGHGWDLKGQPLHLSASGWGDDEARDLAAFTHVTGFTVKGGIDRHPPEVSLSGANLSTRRHYFTSLRLGSREFEQTAVELAALDPSSELHPLAELIAATRFVPRLQWQDSTVLWQATRPASASDSAKLPREIGFVRATDPGFALEASAPWAENTTLRFVGLNRFGLPLDFSNLPQIKRLEFAAGSVVQGSIILSPGLMGLGGVRAESNVILPNLRPSGDATLNLLLEGDLDARQLVLENPVNLVVADGVLANIDLSNPKNRFGLVTGSTGGGSLRLATLNPRLVLRNLSTAGGSLVVVNSGGDIIGENLALGSVSFQAVGTVSLAGSFTSVRGRAAAVTLDGKTGTWILGDVLGDREIRISGAAVLLSGTPITYGRLDISEQTQVLLDPRRLPLVPSVALISGPGWEMVAFLSAADPFSSGNFATLALDEGRDLLGPFRRPLRSDWIRLKLRLTTD
ncbi:MAG: hypothetical protein ORO03_09950, partial [Alphaproteobacteria bacterium]|nr:hypothetical protein [Alphaproteobacteria bacterium]